MLKWALTVFMFHALCFPALLPASQRPSIQAQDLELISEPHGKVRFQKLRQDFGKVRRGEVLTAKFSFENIGRGPILVQAVHADCGCTAVEVDEKKTYLPGDRGEIKVTLDTTDFLGDIEKSVAVMTSASDKRTHLLKLAASISGEIEAWPPIVDFGSVHNAMGAHRRIEIRPLAMPAKQLQITDLHFDSRWITATRQKVMDSWVIDLYIKPFLDQRFLSTTLYVLNNSQSLGHLPVPIRADLVGDISIEPSYLEFGAVKQADSSQQQILLRSSKHFKVLSHRAEIHINGQKVADADRYFEVDIDYQQHERLKRIQARLLHPDEVEGSVHGRLFLETSDPSQPEVVMDFYAFFKR